MTPVMKLLAILFAVIVATPAYAIIAPGNTYNAQVHNACGWQASTTYTYSAGPPTAPFTRVNNGAGWAPTQPGTACGTGTYTSGAALNSYQLLATTSPCTSASSGGPSGAGSNITDGTCHWKYVGPVDYVSLTGWALDNGKYWASGTDYFARDVVNAGTSSDVYQQFSGGCHSTVQPSNTSGSLFWTADNCSWVYVGKIQYTSRNHPIPMSSFWHDSFQGSIAPGTVNFTGSVTSGVLTVTAISGGTLYPKMNISGAGLGTGQFIWAQRSGTTGGIGTYSLGNPFIADVGSEAMTAPYGALTITTPPATHTLDTLTPQNTVISSASMSQANAGYVQGNGSFGTYLLGGSGTSWQVSVSQTVSATTFYFTDTSNMNIMLNDTYHAQLWNDREYVNGSNNEQTCVENYCGIQIWNHNYGYNDSVQPGHYFKETNCNYNTSYGCYFYIEAAPGEGFADTLAANPALALSGYNKNYGVGVRGVNHSALEQLDSLIVFRGLQLTSNVNTVTSAPGRACGGCIYVGNVMDGGNGGGDGQGSPDGVSGFCGGGCAWIGNLIISNGAKLGIWTDYGSGIINNTIVCPSNTCWAGTSDTHNWQDFDGNIFSGNAVFGFAHIVASNYYSGSYSPSFPHDTTFKGTNNATDTASNEATDPPGPTIVLDTTYYALPFYTGSSICGDTLPVGNFTPGTCSTLRSVSPSAAFVAWPGNYRVNPTGPLAGGGSSYTLCSPYAQVWVGFVCSLLDYPINTPDILGNARPQQGGVYDIGAVQSVGAGVVLTTPGRLPFRW